MVDQSARSSFGAFNALLYCTLAEFVRGGFLLRDLGGLFVLRLKTVTVDDLLKLLVGHVLYCLLLGRFRLRLRRFRLRLADSRFDRASIFLAFALSLATLMSAFALILAFLIRSFWAGVSLFLRFLLPPFSARSRYLAERDLRTPHFMPLTP